MEKSVSVEVDNLELQKRSKLRETIMNFEDVLAQHPGATFGDSGFCPLTHSFADGIYVREMFVPKGAYVVGKIHKHAHPNFIMSGTVQVVSESRGYETLKGPVSWISPAGTKRAFRALTDLVWITVHLNPTNTQDLDELEKLVIAPSYEEYHRFINNQRGGFLHRIISKIKHKLTLL